ncbi:MULTISPECIES: glycosyl hydrolase family 18 protein [unclassified Paenibacillus]|uniref:glycosyl hydrolase family 18 protein n=1 Tax=unclassified Paenibacillus TaxID=185978 RepID=UPI001AEB2E41|nr:MULTISPECIES: glycosyl hydrolase family 18 protein [unclassified Paenibacillus]MBP1155418.1 spore germination protein YaaH [Paenibacillus sp. PvP091]MBP1169197.1 spore germination protein YaaH/adenylate kinase family enzyme [Paenibacillus sp. PvR098]MBP2440225.1 spore germination protein YaaH [Paenibacillus sp. PvP052]
MLKRKTLLSLSVLTLFLSSTSSVMAADKTTKYRVYQDARIMLETSDYKSAENYAKSYSRSHVEEIGTRQWLWDNYPRYKVYQHGYSSSAWEFASRDAAVREAAKWGSSNVRDLQSGGWIWDNYPKYRVFQGEITLDSWKFQTQADAVAEARKWANSYIVDLDTNRWVWDNVTENRKSELRNSGKKTYQVYQGTFTADNWKFAYLGDAVNESLKWSNSTIRNTENGKVVYSNVKPYKVYQYDHFLNSFLSLNDAINYAKLYDHTKITNDNAPAVGGKPGTIWNNYPYYQVLQNDKLIADFSTIPAALKYATGFANASIRTYDDGIRIWDNLRKLQFWGWNGSSSDTTIRSHVNNTSGLDVVSPTYFQLADNTGNISDTSNKATVDWLKKQGYSVHPLVANQFDTALTTQFLAKPEARTKFINDLVNKAVALGVDGLNIDFESLAGSDRDRFTAFMRELTQTAHAKKLIISVDLPRGSLSWNDKTAFDHEKLAGIVDYIITMTYDHHWKGSTEPGSVAGLSWVEQGVKEFLSYGIPRDKLIMGIPFYVREWKVDSTGKLDSNRALLMRDLPKLIAEKKASMTWDSRFNQYKVEYKQDGFTNVFWLENEESIKARIAIAKKYDLGGVAAWRLGYESQDLWNVMIREK